MFELAMQGEWIGVNKLWFDQPDAELSQGRIQVAERSIAYEWSFRGEKQHGEMSFFGPTSSFRAPWKDSWHSAELTNFHGYEANGIFKLYGTYPDSQAVEWGWIIELDVRDPHIFQMRMFNVEPDGTIHIAVDLRGKRKT